MVISCWDEMLKWTITVLAEFPASLSGHRVNSSALLRQMIFHLPSNGLRSFPDPLVSMCREAGEREGLNPTGKLQTHHATMLSRTSGDSRLKTTEVNFIILRLEVRYQVLLGRWAFWRMLGIITASMIDWDLWWSWLVDTSFFIFALVGSHTISPCLRKLPVFTCFCVLVCVFLM